jgi:hypothetical protein
MTNNQKMQEIIASFSELSDNPDSVNLSVGIKNNYVDEGFQSNLAHQICQAWEEVDCTELHNKLFGSLKTGKAILEHYQLDGEDDYVEA